jgi:hypothetical protein
MLSRLIRMGPPSKASRPAICWGGHPAFDNLEQLGVPRTRGLNRLR